MPLPNQNITFNPALEANLIKAVSLHSFYRFVQEFWPLVVSEKPVWNWHIEYLCQKVQEVFEDVQAGRPKKYDLIINLPPGSSKCLCEGQCVFTVNGWVLVEEIQPGDGIWSYKDGGVVKRDITAINTPTALCVEITTEEGSVKVSHDHPVLTQRGWVNAGELVEDYDSMLRIKTAALFERGKPMYTFEYRKVTSVKYIGNKKVYHFCIDADEYDDRNFIGEGFVLHNCEVAGNLVLTPNGYVPIEKLQPNDQVVSMTGGGRFFNQKIISCGSYHADCVRVLTDLGNMTEVSNNHPFMTQRGWVEARDLTATDYVCNICEDSPTSVTFAEKHYFPIETVLHLLPQHEWTSVELDKAKRAVTLDSMQRLTEKYPILEPVLHARYRWNKIKHVVPTEKKQVYHIGTEATDYNNQNYFSNTFHVHNSTIFSVLFPAWAWARMPSCRFITASFASDLAIGFAQKSKHVIQSELYKNCFGKLLFTPERKDHYTNQYRGERLVFTTGQSPTGQHAHFILIDDPVDPMAQDREVAIYNINTWMKRVIRSRTVDAQITPLILIMQRLSENDPTGDWLHTVKQAEISGQIVPPVFHVNLPASIEHGQIVKPAGLKRYYTSNLFDPVRLPKHILDERKVWMSQADYSAQYDQNPLPTEGLMFRVQNIQVISAIDPLDPIIAKVRYWDKAISTKVNACFTVGTLVGRTVKGRFIVLDMQRGQWGAFDRETVILQTAKADGPKVLIGIEMEPGSGGIESAQYTVRNLAGFNVFVDRASSAKEARAEPLAIQVEHRNVFLMEGSWNAQLLSELGSFPRGRLKDSVDATTGAFKLLCGMGQRVAGGL